MGHLSPLEAPSALVTAIRGFIGELDSVPSYVISYPPSRASEADAQARFAPCMVNSSDGKATPGTFG
ncbi:hypothetical protein OKW43_001320 [Paraburkholderia sp. WC7.3g]|uniref:Uncharacterized protein n=1 Tax=Paraburkholderia podalyriae TaxID=1938811 RepID=A0ABR7PPR5_9BURK|nr:hypothetical protein [Paraburkholderia podalyriae]MBC8748274.1 hypothetical protein [Paraburkholderia podalyriae]